MENLCAAKNNSQKIEWFSFLHKDQDRQTLKVSESQDMFPMNHLRNTGICVWRLTSLIQWVLTSKQLNLVIIINQPTNCLVSQSYNVL